MNADGHDGFPYPLPAPPSRLSCYIHTSRHLRAGQLVRLVRQRLFGFRRVSGRADLGAARADLKPAAFLAPEEPAIGPGEIEFIGVRAPFDPQRPDWVAGGRPKLWCYNLHYFDWLHWSVFDEATRAGLIDDWIAANPQGAANAWEPYTLSLRIVNWVKYLVRMEAGARPARWLESLALQLAWLARNLEDHLLANHLFKNAKALLVGASLFSGPGAVRLRTQGLNLLLRQIDEQFLPDGGHYERSPMYHQLCLEDLLDVVVLLNAAPEFVSEAQRAQIKNAAHRALGFLEGIVGGDDEIPLFNDAAHGIAAPARRMIEWGRGVLGSGSPVGTNSFQTGSRAGNEFAPGGRDDRMSICFPDTGYYGYRRDGDSLIIDCGPVGPDYQPGHAHSDALSFELCVAGQRVIVDSGTFDYEPGPLRRYLRSTIAHSTVCVDRTEQSETWGVFRVARRARPLHAELEQDGNVLRFRGAHDGYRRLAGQVVHRREITIDAAGAWQIADRLDGTGIHRAASFLHLHPEIGMEAQSDRIWRLHLSDGTELGVEFSGGDAVTIERGWYCPRFGKRHSIAVFVQVYEGVLPAEFGYRLWRIH